MKNLKKLVATATLIGIIIIGVTDVKAGIILGLNGENQQCTEVKDEQFDNGIILGLTGIILGLVGLDSEKTESNTDCGIILG